MNNYTIDINFIDAKPFREELHPRGQPKNAGQFVESRRMAVKIGLPRAAVKVSREGQIHATHVVKGTRPATIEQNLAHHIKLLAANGFAKTTNGNVYGHAEGHSVSITRYGGKVRIHFTYKHKEIPPQEKQHNQQAVAAVAARARTKTVVPAATTTLPKGPITDEKVIKRYMGGDCAAFARALHKLNPSLSYWQVTGPSETGDRGGMPVHFFVKNEVGMVLDVKGPRSVADVVKDFPNSFGTVKKLNTAFFENNTASEDVRSAMPYAKLVMEASNEQRQSPQPTAATQQAVAAVAQRAIRTKRIVPAVAPPQQQQKPVKPVVAQQPITNTSNATGEIGASNSRTGQADILVPMQKVFGTTDPQAAAAILGNNLPQGYNSSTKFVADGWETYFKQNGTTIGVAKHSLLPDGSMYHELMSLRESSQGSGLATAYLRNCMGAYRKAGIKKVKLHAALEAGGYVWPKFGFQPDDYHNGWDDVKSSINKAIMYDPDIPEAVKQQLWALWRMPRVKETLWKIVDHPWGKRIMPGTNYHCFLDMTDKDSMARFDAMIARGTAKHVAKPTAQQTSHGR